MDRKKLLIVIIIFTAIIIFLTIKVDPSKRYQKLSISENKWNSIINSREENRNLKLQDIEFNDYSLIIDEKNNTLYYSLINESKNKYNPSVSFDVEDKNINIAILSDEITDEKVKNNYEFKVMIYNDKTYHIYNLKCTDLPILNIEYDDIEKESEGKKTNVQIYLFNNLTHVPNRVTISDGRIKKVENNYMFSLNMMTPGKNIRDNRRSLLKMKPNSEYVLKPINDDIENIEEHIENNKPPRSTHLELFVNSEYRGVYSLDYIPEKDNRPNEK